MRSSPQPVALGAASAAVLSAAFGVFVMGLMTVLAEASPAIKALLTWSKQVGSLTGKTGVGVMAWLCTWLVLGNLWGGKASDFTKYWRLGLALIILGALFMFPPFFELFG